jgi:hypothetical protein
LTIGDPLLTNFSFLQSVDYIVLSSATLSLSFLTLFFRKNGVNRVDKAVVEIHTVRPKNMVEARRRRYMVMLRVEAQGEASSLGQHQGSFRHDELSRLLE